MGPLLLLAAATGGTALDGAKCLTLEHAKQLVVLRSRDSNLRAVVDPAHGGQMVSLRLIGRGRADRELLYRGLDFCPVKGWDGKAPILWPATGRNYAAAGSAEPKALSWTERGTLYPMPIHGFAKDSDWQVVARKSTGRESSVTLALSDSAETRRYYPFAFRVTVTYVIDGKGLRAVHRVVAGSNGRTMPFSIGNHITFSASPSGNISTAATQRVVLDEAGRPQERRAQVPLRTVSLGSLGTNTAYSMSGYGSGEARLVLANGLGDTLTIWQIASRQPNADPIRFNLWGDPAAGYFSPEPWLGLQNSLGSGQGVVGLGDGEQFTWTFGIRVSAQR